MVAASQFASFAQRALAEDLPDEDLTTVCLLSAEHRNMPMEARIYAGQAGILCGMLLAEAILREVSQGIRWQAFMSDGQRLSAGALVASAQGPAAMLLRAERTVLNALQHLCGVATRTAECVTRARAMNSQVQILDTRKTLPGLRALQKYAVRVGGGQNHRMSLSEGILIKDNHWALLRKAGTSLEEALQSMRRELAVRGQQALELEVEVETLDQVREALQAGADALLLDNMPPAQLREAVQLAQGHAHTEASGGVRLESLAEIAATGVERISIGALTHSAPALDLTLDLRPFPQETQGASASAALVVGT